MEKVLDWLSENKYQVHLTAFFLMIISATGMFHGAQNDFDVLIWVLLSLVVLVNIGVVLTR